MLGLVNVVRCCCPPPARGGGVGGLVVFALLIAAVIGGGAAVVQALAAGAGPLAAANAAVGTALGVIISVVISAVVLAGGGAAVWFAWDRVSSARAVRAYVAHTARLDALALERRGEAAIENGRQPRQRIASERVRARAVAPAGRGRS